MELVHRKCSENTAAIIIIVVVVIESRDLRFYILHCANYRVLPYTTPPPQHYVFWPCIQGFNEVFLGGKQACSILNSVPLKKSVYIFRR